MASRIDYDRRQYAVYSAGRSLSPAVADLWSGVLARYLDRAGRPAIVDVGSGIGTYSELLAERFDAEVTGVDPSFRMRAVAAREHAHPRVRYLRGSAERLPLLDESCDASLLSYVIHHVADREGCANELRRVLRPGGLVILRSTLRGSLPHVPWFEFFPSARSVAERRMPSVTEVTALFTGLGFTLVAGEAIPQEMAPSLTAFHARIRHRAVSTLELISDAEFEDGLERLRLAAAGETEPRPVIEPVNLLVFRRP